ncbi:fibronectin type III domain-containing protein [Phytohabitans rumicis]|uniref:fibronectin type III domain-containing protein n=1 Tax=Phytohabitans rumicis TaxID=1076125 RepID=UPI00156450AA|nr:fibronectin type III domain-containing protein [Phytohabitans rumicis]
MKYPPWTKIVLGLTTSVLIGLPGFATPAGATPKGDPATGTVQVKIHTPDGIPATVTLAGKTRQVAAKAPTGTSTLVSLSLPAGLYHVPPVSTTVDGVRYVGHASPPVAVVKSGAMTTVNVTYAPDGGAHHLVATDLTRTSLKLSWNAPAGARFVLRRTPGGTPVSLKTLGVGVPVKGTSAADQGLKPGTRYTYSLFTQTKHGWTGPLVSSISTTPPVGSTQATYVAAPTTLLAVPADLAAAQTTGTGVQVVLRSQVPPPLLGSAVVLPISAALPGGFLGVVTSITPDGRTLGLAAGALIDAFDYYELDVPEFSVAAAGGGGAPSATAKAAAAKAADVDCGGSAEPPRSRSRPPSRWRAISAPRSTSTSSWASRSPPARPWTSG